MLYIKVKKIFSKAVFAFILSSVLFAATASADPLFTNLMDSGGTIFSGMRGVIYFVSGFGIIGVAIAGFFGKINWKWLSAIIIGLVVISLTTMLLNYMTEEDTFDTTGSLITGS